MNADERLTYLEKADRVDQEQMLQFLAGYTPQGFDKAVELIAAKHRRRAEIRANRGVA